MALNVSSNDSMQHSSIAAAGMCTLTTRGKNGTAPRTDCVLGSLQPHCQATLLAQPADDS